MKPNDQTHGRLRRVVVAGCLLPLAGCASYPLADAVAPAPPVAADSIAATLILIGDAGHAYQDDPVLAEAARIAARDPDSTLVVFLGDIIYPSGLPARDASDREAAEETLYAQTNVVAASGAYGILQPGNHDWAGRSPDGFNRIIRMQTLVEELDIERLTFLPEDGCPGPHAVDFGTRLRVIAIDAHWWMTDRAELYPEHCPVGFPATVVDSLATLVAGAGDRDVVVTSHHPLEAFGPHGGYFTLQDHLFPLTRAVPWLYVPLPILGSIYPIYRRSGARAQDNSSRRYRSYVEDVTRALTGRPPLAWAGGHEHSLQVLLGDEVGYHIVSGSGAYGRITQAGWKENTIFSLSVAGFAVLEFTRDGRVRFSFMSVAADGIASEVFSMWMVTERDQGF